MSDGCDKTTAADPGCPLAWADEMVPRCLEVAKEAKAEGRPVVGIMCEYTPREIIMAAGGVAASLCGGSGEMIPPAEDTLPANLCPLIKSTFGYALTRSNPFLEMADLLVAETTCDGKKKMYELLAESRPMHVVELPQKPAEADALAHWCREVERLAEVLERRFGVRITDAALREAIGRMNRQRRLRRDLAALMADDDPPLTGGELLGMQSIVACAPAALEACERALETLPGRRLDPPAAERVRVLLTGVPMPHGQDRVMDIIEDSGGLVVCQENCSGLKPLVEDVDADAPDPLRAIAEKYFHLPCSVMTANDGRLEVVRDLVRDYRPQCIVELTWQACLTYDVESERVRRLAGELGLPYLKIETDYSPSDSARIAMRVEALVETVRGAGL